MSYRNSLSNLPGFLKVVGTNLEALFHIFSCSVIFWFWTPCLWIWTITPVAKIFSCIYNCSCSLHPTPYFSSLASPPITLRISSQELFPTSKSPFLFLQNSSPESVLQSCLFFNVAKSWLFSSRYGFVGRISFWTIVSWYEKNDMKNLCLHYSRQLAERLYSIGAGNSTNQRQGGSRRSIYIVTLSFHSL